MTKDEDRRALLQVVSQYELTVAPMRLQTLSIFLAAVGIIIGLAQPSRSVGALLLIVTVGLWIIDIRHRDILRLYIKIGRQLEEEMFPDEPGEDRLFRDRLNFERHMTIGILFKRWGPMSPRRTGGLIAFQVGIDIVFLGVIGYALSLLICGDRGGWVATLAAFVPLVVAFVIVLFIPRSDSRGGTDGGDQTPEAAS